MILNIMSYIVNMTDISKNKSVDSLFLASTTMSLVEAPPALSLCTTWWWLIPVTLVPLISMMMSWTLRPAAAAGEFAITSPLMNSRL